jgi:DNA-binding beta-propeller fold protein YncE
VNYSPTRILYISEPFENAIAAIDLTDDGVIFRVVGVRHFHAKALNAPVDLAPAEIETSDPNWASNTTLEGGADFYVVNRGNTTLVRMRQDGTVVAVRRVRLANGRSLGPARLNGIAVSPDGSKIWVTVTGQIPGQGKQSGAVLELPAFEE